MFKKENLNTIHSNFKEVFSRKPYIISFIIIFLLITYLFNYFTDSTLIKGNLGIFYYNTLILLQFLIAFLFALFLPLSFYKYIKFSDFSIKENSSSAIGTFLGILVAGCPACSVTIASYIGLAGAVSLLPWYGLELKIISVPLLIYANYSVLLTLNTCNIKIKSKKNRRNKNK